MARIRKLRRSTLRIAAMLVVVSLALGALASAPPLDRLDGSSTDLLFWLRHQMFGQAHAPATSPSVVVAIDEATYRTPPFAGTPKVMWTPAFAAVLDALVAGGAIVVGFDLILPASVERHIPKFDRPFLISLRNASKEGRVLLAKTQHSVSPISPHRGQIVAVGRGANIRAVNLAPDPDGVIRRVPLWFETASGDHETSFSMELAARAAGEAPAISDQAVTFRGHEISGGAANAMPLNFEGGAGAIPTYSLADLHACAGAGDSAFFTRHFAGKVVLVGAVLDVEDRKLTSKRFVAGDEAHAIAARCSDDPAAIIEPAPRRETVPGVYVHATAVNNLLRGDALASLPRGATGAITLVFVLIAGLAAFERRIWGGALGLLAGAILWTVIATAVFSDNTALPLLDLPIAGAVAFAAMLAFRIGFVDRKRSQLKRAFALYLSTAVIDRMLASDKLPTLGGEERELTLFFSDIAGFTGISEHLGPVKLVSLMNTYLAAMTDIIEEHGGFVDKYIGDAIVAVFGAPHEAPDHALNAVRAALECRARLANMQHEFDKPADMVIRARIGLNTGTVLVGNIGSKRRFNYTVMGDPVNVAARLEGVNKQYGTSILMSESTAAACGEAVLAREIDRVRVKGRDASTRLIEPLAEARSAREADRARADAYGAALTAYQAGDFAAAAEAFAALAATDPPARMLEAQAREHIGTPPATWDGVTTLKSK